MITPYDERDLEAEAEAGRFADKKSGKKSGSAEVDDKPPTVVKTTGSGAHKQNSGSFTQK
tara:strand:- start:480 stop:659 length:180 start_codon:yes stop_codon:yes gene_type:complete